MAAMSRLRTWGWVLVIVALLLLYVVAIGGVAHVWH
jgi:hypothetical protein